MTQKNNFASDHLKDIDENDSRLNRKLVSDFLSTFRFAPIISFWKKYLILCQLKGKYIRNTFCDENTMSKHTDKRKHNRVRGHTDDCINIWYILFKIEKCEREYYKEKNQ